MSEPIKRELWVATGNIKTKLGVSIDVSITPLAKNSKEKATAAAEEWLKESKKAGDTRQYQIKQIYPVK